MSTTLSRFLRFLKLQHVLTNCVHSAAIAFSLLTLFGFESRLQAQTVVSIHDIMVTNGAYPLPNSPYLYSHYGQPVSVTGVVVGVMSTGGFYISEPSSNWDNLVATAEGMPVFATAGNNPSCAVVGNSVTVIGDVVNSNAVTAADTPGTGLQPTSCTVNSTGNAMTQAISISAALNSFGGALEYTGMAASNSTFYAVSPTGGMLTEATETVTSNGQFWATLSSNTATNNHLFRSAGVAPDEYTVATGSSITTWTGNPGRILIDTTTFGGTPVDITVGQGITCTVPSSLSVGATKGIGLIDYTLGYARLLIFPTSLCSVSGTVAATTSAAADATHFHVGTLDLDRFYSTTGATTGSVPVSSSAYTRRLTKAANAIVNSLGVPDILSLQEVQDLPTLTDLSTAVSTLGGLTYAPYLLTSADPNSLNLGFLVNSSTVTVDNVVQADAGATYTNASGSSATLWQRPPLVMTAEVHRTGKSYPVTVVNVHMAARDNIGDSTLGPDIRLQRAAQAYDLSQLIQDYETAGQNVIVDGNFNAFEYSDGFVDVLGIVKGAPAASGTVLLYQATATTNALTDFTTDVSQYQRYNYIERGDAVSFEHILASATVTAANTAATSLASYETAVVQPHFSTDFAAINENSSTTAAGLTPHDGQVVAFAIPAVPTTASISATTLNFGNVDIGNSVSKTVTVTNTSGFTSTVTISGIAISGADPADYTQTSNCTTLADAATCTITVTFTPTAVGIRTATLTVSNDSTSDPTLTTALTGVGVATTATLTPASANFGSLLIGNTSAAQTFTWTNTSDEALTISSVAISGDFALASNACSGTVASSGSCAVTVTFTPSAAGARTGTVTVVSNSSANAALTATLTGTGLAPVTASASTLSFGNVDVGATSAAQVVTITNATAATVSLTSLAITGDYAETTTCGSTLAASATCTISVRFTPTATGTRTGTVTLATSNSTTPVVSIALTGVGVDFSLALTPTSGSVIAGLGTTMTATLTPISGYANTLTVSCSTTASGSTCIPATTSIALAAVTTDKVTLTTTSEYTVVGYGGLGVSGGRSWWMSLLALLTLGAISCRRRFSSALKVTMGCLLLLAVTSGLSGCSGKTPAENTPYTAAGTYTYTVSATDGFLSHSATYTLTVSAK